jgi:hypothetical protein
MNVNVNIFSLFNDVTITEFVYAQRINDYYIYVYEKEAREYLVSYIYVTN